MKAQAGTWRILTLILVSKTQVFLSTKLGSIVNSKMQSSYAFTLRRRTGRLVNGTYVDTSSLPHTAIGQGRRG